MRPELTESAQQTEYDDHADGDQFPVRTDRAFGRAYFIRNVIRFAIALPGLGIILHAALAQGQFLLWGIAILAADILWWAIDDYLRFSAYACPKCGRQLGNAAKVIVGEERAICFDCNECRVRWDTDLRVPSS